MYVITVAFLIRAPHAAAFQAAVMKNAARSLEWEPACRHFDVCTSLGDGPTAARAVLRRRTNAALATWPGFAGIIPSHAGPAQFASTPVNPQLSNLRVLPCLLCSSLGHLEQQFAYLGQAFFARDATRATCVDVSRNQQRRTATGRPDDGHVVGRRTVAAGFVADAPVGREAGFEALSTGLVRRKSLLRLCARCSAQRLAQQQIGFRIANAALHRCFTAVEPVQQVAASQQLEALA